MKKDLSDGDIAADLNENEENENGREQLMVTMSNSCMNWNKSICKKDKARFDECATIRFALIHVSISVL